jgi:3-deoxy-D-manno-octulosonic-acid transferase
LKFDVCLPPPLPVVASLRAAFAQAGATPVIVCGSTVEGEEALLLPAFEAVLAGHRRALMVLAPRHPERFGEVAQLLAASGVPWWRRSEWSSGPIAGGVLLLDSIGELAAIYALGDMAFVGGSLVPRGGHNILEPAQHGIPVLVGKHTQNFRDVVESFQSRDAVRVVGPAELAAAWLELASSELERRALGQRAAAAVRAQTGATERTLACLEGLLKPQLPICERAGGRATLPQ